MNNDDASKTVGKTPRVLVFPCGSEIGLEIHRSLSWSRHCSLVGLSSVSSHHGKYVFKECFEGVPFVDAPDFVSELDRFVRSREIDFIFPAHDSVVLKLAQSQERLACTVIGSPPATCEVCRSKGATYARFRGILPVPAVYTRDDMSIPFPAFLKPDVGQGSKGVQIAQSRTELDVFLKRDPSVLILEHLPGAEYTVDCFTDRFGKLRFAGARERMRVTNGISVDTRPAQGEEFGRLAERINETLVFRGPWFFQVKRRAGGELTLMEIAPRVSGAMGLYRNAGVNIPLLSLFDAMGYDVEVECQKFDIEMDRALFGRFRIDVRYRHVYLDFDDTLVLNGKLNPLMVAFVYQCRNRGVSVHLLSRHAGDLGLALRQYGLDGLFSSVQVLDKTAKKSDFVAKREAIFIDDSFAERKAVHDALGIATFGVDAVESLMDWTC